MPAAKLTPLDRQQVAATFAATNGDAAETARRHGLTRKHVNVMAMRYPEFAAARPTKLVTVLPARRVCSVEPVSAATAITAVIAANRGRSHVALSSVTAKVAECMDTEEPSTVDTSRLLQVASAHAKLHPPDTATSGTTNLAIQINIG